MKQDRIIRKLKRISIHALRVEGDIDNQWYFEGVEVKFLSTPSGWRATDYMEANKMKRYISIHALRVEGDKASRICYHGQNNFYPRPPGGGRHNDVEKALQAGYISIHALRVEGDSKNGQSFRLFLRKREKNLPL